MQEAIEFHAKGKDSTEEDQVEDKHDPNWWDPEPQLLQGYGDEADYAFWRKKAINLQLTEDLLPLQRPENHMRGPNQTSLSFSEKYK